MVMGTDTFGMTIAFFFSSELAFCRPFWATFTSSIFEEELPVRQMDCVGAVDCALKHTVKK
jgi:hypothetical protein